MNVCAYFLLQNVLFVLPVFHLSLLVLAYVDIQRHLKSDLSLHGGTNFIYPKAKPKSLKVSVYSCSHMLWYLLTSTQGEGIAFAEQPPKAA